MPSKQFAHLQEASRQRLQALVPPDCPLRVERQALFGRGGFKAITLDDRDCQVGRFEVVAAYITGFVTAWQRAARRLQARRPFHWPPEKGAAPSKWCANDDQESHGWCMNRDASECHCTCNCHRQ